MATNRCFDTFIPNTTASDYVNTTRQKTLFKDVNYNVTHFSTANPKKKNGSTYNNNYSVRETNNVNGVQGCLAFAKDYQLLLDITKGETILANQNISCGSTNATHKMDAPVYDAWSGILYSVDYLKHGVDNILNYDYNNCVLHIDPSNKLFYDGCPLTDLTGYPPEWFNVVDISFNNTNYFIEANRAQILNGFNYPSKVIFGNINEINTCEATNCTRAQNI